MQSVPIHVRPAPVTAFAAALLLLAAACSVAVPEGKAPAQRRRTAARRHQGQCRGLSEYCGGYAVVTLDGGVCTLAYRARVQDQHGGLRTLVKRVSWAR